MPSQSEPTTPGAVEPPEAGDIEAGMQPITQLPLLPGSSPPPQNPADFDRWLRRELGRLHNDVLREPVPARLMRVIEESGLGRTGCSN